MLRFELAVLLWGGGFFFLCVYTLIANILVRVSVSRLIRCGAEHFDLSFPRDEVYAGDTVSAHVRSILPRVILPVISVSFQATLSWNTRRCRIQGCLQSGKNSRTIDFVPRRRGIYSGSGVSLMIQDILGFTVSSVYVENRNTLTVLTSPLEPSRLPAAGGRGGKSSVIHNTVRRSDELLDVRAYYPGDDVRRMNWKMFAHLGELYIRIGEELPPPNAVVLIVVDTAPPEGFPLEVMGGLLDRTVAAAWGSAMTFLDRGCEVWISCSGASSARRIVGREREDVGCFFAGVWWSDDPIPLPENGSFAACVFSFPGSPGIQGCLSSLRGKKTVFLPSGRVIPKAEKPKPVKYILFNSRKTIQDMPQRGAYLGALEKERSRLSGAWGGIKVAEY